MRFYVNTEHLGRNLEYPSRFQTQNLIKSSVVIFALIQSFLLLFRPFGVYDPELKLPYFFICFIHAFAPALVFFCYFTLLNYFRKTKHQINWTLLQEYIHIGAVLLLIGTVSFLLRDVLYTNPNNWSWNYFFEEIRNCLVAGIFFYFFLRITSFYFQEKKGSGFVLQFTPLTKEPLEKVSKSEIFINTQVKQDDFNLDIEQLLFVKADGNYIELTKLNDTKIVSEVKRISLTQFESQVAHYPHFFRCHRTYLVNMFRIEKVSGNSQGYLLSFHETNIKIPVSRKQIESFNNYYEELRTKYIA